ncbi:MAG TPA: ABC transporter permease [Candidatus Acidoferrum sp.]|nr:ABC transporter permease [Candidatus Acidoferrum sp.]
MMRWLRRRFGKPVTGELDHELQFHIEQLVREKIAQGMTPAQARREANLEFGGTESIKEDLRDVHRVPVWDTMLANLKYAWRSLRAAPSFSLTVIATLTLGIGANTAVFSAIDAVLLRPLPYPNADRLLVLHEYRAKRKSPESAIAPARLENWHQLNTTFTAISGYYTEDTTDNTGGGPDAAPPTKVTRALVAPHFLRVLGISAALGHDFPVEEELSGTYSPPSVLISDRFWRDHFRSDPGILGKPLIRGKQSATVIGIMPPGFNFPENADMWYLVSPNAPYATNRRNTWYTGIGRLRPAVSESQARANLDLVQAQLAQQFPDTDKDITVKTEELKESTVGTSRSSLWLLFGAVSILLLIACANVSALVLARGMERDREFSVRVSLGGSRGRIVAQVLTETLLLAIGGTAIGLALAAASARVLSSMAKSIPRIGEVSLDWRLFLYTAGCAILVAILSGLFPALRASLASPAGALSRGGRGQVSGRRPAQWTLVTIQIALAVCLISGAALLLRSFRALSQVSPGFDADHALAFRVTGGYAETVDIPKLKQSIQRILDAVQAVPGVQSVATALEVPGVPYKYPIELVSPDSGFDPDHKISAESRFVSTGYFSTMRIPILSGVACDNHSEGTGVVVNRSLASAYFGSLNPLGRHLRPVVTGPGVGLSTILGVAGDAREAGMNQEPAPTVYWCNTVIDPARVYLVRTAGDPSALAPAVRRAVQSVEPARAVYDLAPVPAQLSEAFGEVRLRTLLLTLFAATALTLACVGLYGTMTYLFTTKRREIGLRMALGATRSGVGLRFVGRGLAVAGLGVVAGLALTAWSARFISGMLYAVRTNDVTALGGAMITMLAVALVASAVPAIRVTRIDPMRTLREE